MKKNRTISLYYCSSCKATMRHAETPTTSTCLRCGNVKTVTRIVKNAGNKQPDLQPEWN